MRRLWIWAKSLFIKKPEPVATKVPVEVYQNASEGRDLDGNSVPMPLTVNALVQGGTLDQRDFFRNVISVMRHVVNSTKFQDIVLEFSDFQHTDDNPVEVFDKFMSGKDLYEEYADKEMDIDLTLYFKNNRTVGYTYPNTRRQWINMKFIAHHRLEAISVAVGNIVHEYMHNLGYVHKGNKRNWFRNWESVPYRYGDTAKEVALEFLGSGRDINFETE